MRTGKTFVTMVLVILMPKINSSFFLVHDNTLNKESVLNGLKTQCGLTQIMHEPTHIF